MRVRYLDGGMNSTAVCARRYRLFSAGRSRSLFDAVATHASPIIHQDSPDRLLDRLRAVDVGCLSDNATACLELPVIRVDCGAHHSLYEGAARGS